MEYRLPAPSQPKPELKQLPTARKRSNKRQTVPLMIWLKASEKAGVQRIAEQEGLSLSQTGKAFVVEGLRQKLHIQQEILAEPIMRKLLREELRPLKNNLSDFHGRSLYEIGQVRWLFVNRLWREDVMHPNKPHTQLTEDGFYQLLDRARQETLQSIHQWGHIIAEAVNEVKKRLEGEENTP